MSKISRFTSKAVQLAKNAVGERGEVAAPEEGGGFADYAVVSLHCLRVYLEKSYREALDLLSEMPHILREIGLEPADLPNHSTLVKWFDRIKTALWRVLLRLSAQLHDPSGHAAIDATFFDRENASKHYCRQTNYRVQTLKATALVDTESQAILDVHCTTEKRHDTQLGWQVPRRNAGNLATGTFSAYEVADSEYAILVSQRPYKVDDTEPRALKLAFAASPAAFFRQALAPNDWYRPKDID